MAKRAFEAPFAGLQSVWIRLSRSAFSISFLFLLIEFFDELHYGVEGATLPFLRADLGLTYAQVGLLLGLPQILSTFIEPVIMLLGDTPLRKRLILGGAVVIGASLLAIAGAQNFPVVLLAFIFSYPASGAFVTLSQATLMDLNPGRTEHAMARWTVFGSLGNLIGPMMVSAGFLLGLGWRWNYILLFFLCLGLALTVLFSRFPRHHFAPQPAIEHSSSVWTSTRTGLKQIMENLLAALHSARLMRWVILLEFSDLLMDVFTGYAALYLVDVAGFTPAQTGVLLTLLMLTHLVSDMLLIPLLERVPGRRIVRLGAALALLILPAWLLAPWTWAKIAGLVAIPLCTTGWYQVLQGEAYASLPGKSGTVMALTSVAGSIHGVLSWMVGASAALIGLPGAMWLLLLGPIMLVLFVPPVAPIDSSSNNFEVS